MKHTTKLLLLNILLCSAPALQAMGTVRSFGARAFRAASASAAKFNAQMFKTAMKSPKVQYFNSFAVAGFAAGLTSFIYKDHLKQMLKEEIEEKNCTACSNLPAKEKYNLCRKHAKHLMVFEKMRNQFGVNDRIGFTIQPGLRNAYAAIGQLIVMGDEFMDGEPLERDFVLGHELMHIKNRHHDAMELYEKKLTAEGFKKQNACYAEVTNLIKSANFWDWKRWSVMSCDDDYEKCRELSTKGIKEKLFAQERIHECEADEGAVLTLGTIEGGMRSFGALPDKNSQNGWKLPADRSKEKDLKDVHPSDADRCRALLALVEKYPDKFPKPFVDRINSLNP